MRLSDIKKMRKKMERNAKEGKSCRCVCARVCVFVSTVHTDFRPGLSEKVEAEQGCRLALLYCAALQETVPHSNQRRRRRWQECRS